MTVVPLPLLAHRPDAAAGSTPSASGCASSRCGTSSSGLPRSIAARVATHPCYSAEAHRTYARMHVPVAPGCNIQCHYCNRKFDCSNESRPGVTTGLLSPERAVEKVGHVRSMVPQLRVIGVAGPGEPLANARRTLGTLEMISREHPDLTLCVSTNGLTVLDHVDRIVSLGIAHVTVTVNMTDPEIGERIYPWITFGGRRLTGRGASRVLTERQLAGIEALTSRGVLCKVNSVLIPGINDEHLLEVSQTVRSLGAFLHNVMPLVSAPEHGTHYGLTGQRGPTPQELRDVQDRCEALGAGDPGGMSMTMMRHCRQCRADAVGLLDEDLGAQFAGPARTATPPVAAGTSLARPRRRVTVLVAVATSSGILVDQHFGHAQEFRIYEAGAGYARLVETRRVDRYCHGPDDCPPGQPAPDPGEAGAAAALAGCAAVLCSRIGSGPRRRLGEQGIEAVEVYDVIEHAVARAGERLAGAVAARQVSAS
ncbi:MAG TPA: nitrogenase cofactor biosynthesis protein NifB [Kineosporiaceae bacterium]